MLFIENRNFIKPKNLKYTSFIMTFNVKHNETRSFFLKINDWDKFSSYMSKNHPEILLELEYLALKG